MKENIKTTKRVALLFSFFLHLDEFHWFMCSQLPLMSLSCLHSEQLEEIGSSGILLVSKGIVGEKAVGVALLQQQFFQNILLIRFIMITETKTIDAFTFLLQCQFPAVFQ